MTPFWTARRTASACGSAAALLVGGGLALTACRARPGPRGARISATPTSGGVLHLATLSDVRGLDPAVEFDTESQPFLGLIFAGLIDYDPNGNLVGDLAERWEAAPDGKSYRFILRRDVAMQDGNTLTADDVKRSIERALHPDTPSPGVSFFERLGGLAEYRARTAPTISGVVVESSHVLTVRLERPDATFLQALALPFLRPVCRSAGHRYDDSFQRHACGAGPFRLDTWEPGRLLRLRRFDGYFVPGRPYLDAIEMRMDVPRLTQRFQFERGEQDFLVEFDRPDWIYYRSHPDWSRYGTEWIESSTLGDFMNVEMPPFDDVRVRRAVAAALNRPQLAKYNEGGSRVTGHLIPPGIPGYDPAYRGQTFDLERARALMREAGYPFDPVTGRGGYPKVIPYYASEGETAARWSQLLQYDLAKIGIRTEIRMTSFAQFLALVGRPKTAHMGFAGWNLDYPDPSDFFEPVFTTAAIAQEDSQNRAFYRNPRLDALLDRAHEELDPERRIEMYREAERIVVDDAPWVFAYNPIRFELAQPYVRDYHPHRVWRLFFKNVWIDAAGKRAANEPSESSAAGIVGAVAAWPEAMRRWLPRFGDAAAGGPRSGPRAPRLPRSVQ